MLVLVALRPVIVVGSVSIRRGLRGKIQPPFLVELLPIVLVIVTVVIIVASTTIAASAVATSASTTTASAASPVTVVIVVVVSVRLFLGWWPPFYISNSAIEAVESSVKILSCKM